MKRKRLEVTYYKGRPLAAYYWLPGRSSDFSARTERMGPELLVDFDQAGHPIGIEILDPRGLSIAVFNELLRSLGFAAVTSAELSQLRAA